MSKEDNRVRFTFRLPDELFDKVKNEAEKMGVSVNSLILKILWDWEESNSNGR